MYPAIYPSLTDRKCDRWTLVTLAALIDGGQLMAYSGYLTGELPHGVVIAMAIIDTQSKGE